MKTKIINGKPFDKALVALPKDFTVGSMRTNALARIQAGKDADISQNGNYTREGWVYTPNTEGAYLVRDSPILDNPTEATEAHRNGNEFYLGKEFTLENGILVPYNQKPIHTNRFGEEEITSFIFEDQAEAYGQFLKEAGIDEMPVYLIGKNHVDRQKQQFARQNWFNGLGVRSGLNGSYRSLNYNIGVFGVLASDEVAMPQKISDKYERFISELEGLPEDLRNTIAHYAIKNPSKLKNLGNL